MKDAALFFLDESTNDDLPTPASALTGIVVPTASYPKVRAAFYQAIISEIRPQPQHVNLDPPPLHFSNFLRHRSDDEHFEIFEALASILLTNDLRIIRVGFYRTPATLSAFSSDSQLIGLCWLALTSLLDPILSNTVLIPVLDAAFVASFQPVVHAMSSRVHNADLFRASGLPAWPNPNFQNLGEVFYCDDKYSALIQLVDQVAGLRRVLETERLTGAPHRSPYKRRLAQIASSLDSLIIHEELFDMAEG
ncbi:MAG: hypothetical protein ACJ76N_26605 [Thermoanaerobaculia bacterium]